MPENTVYPSQFMRTEIRVTGSSVRPPGPIDRIAANPRSDPQP